MLASPFASASELEPRLALERRGDGSKFGFESALSFAPSRSASSSADDHAKYCGCGTACDPESCCCSPHGEILDSESNLSSEAADASGDSSPRRSGWRFCKAPCRPQGLPSSSPVNPQGKFVIPTKNRGADASSLDDALLPAPTLSRPRKRASRLDDPPENACLA